MIAAAVMAAGAATLWFWPFQQIADMDRSLVRWPEPQLVISADRGGEPVLVQTTYTIAADKEQQFLQAMASLRQSRLRTGATDWALYQDGQNPRAVHRAVHRGQLGRAPQAAPRAANRYRPAVPRRRCSTVRPVAANQPLPGRRRPRLARAGRSSRSSSCGPSAWLAAVRRIGSTGRSRIRVSVACSSPEGGRSSLPSLRGVPCDAVLWNGPRCAGRGKVHHVALRRLLCRQGHGTGCCRDYWGRSIRCGSRESRC